MGPDPALVVELHLVDEPVGGVSLDEVRLHEAVQERVVVPGRVGEAAVAPLGGHVTPADGDAEELGAGVERRGATAAPGSTATRWPSRPSAATTWRPVRPTNGLAPRTGGSSRSKVESVIAASPHHRQPAPARSRSEWRRAPCRRPPRRPACRCGAAVPSSGPPPRTSSQLSVHSVSMRPGATAWTRISGPRALASSSVRWLSAAFETAYGMDEPTGRTRRWTSRSGRRRRPKPAGAARRRGSRSRRRGC